MSRHLLTTHGVRLALVLCIAAHAPAMLAQPAPLTLQQAIVRAVAENPALRGSEYLLQASQARAARAAQAPPLHVGADFEDFAGSGELDGVDALQTTLRLSGVLELGGKRRARAAVAERDTDLEAIAQEMRRLDLLAQVATRFADTAARQERLEVARETTRIAATTVERVAERISIGAAPRYELGRAQIRLSLARIDEEHAEHELASARVRLAATWGATTPEFERVSANLFELPATRPLAALMQEVDGSPEIRAMLSRERLAEARLNLARSAGSPEIGWSAGVRHIEALGDSAFVASFTVPIGARHRAAPGLEEARALQAMAPLEVEATRIEASAELFELYQELSHARLEAETLRNEVQPQTEGVLRATEQAFRQGRAGFLEYANAQQELLEIRRDAVAAAAEYHAVLIEIERLTGRSLGAGDTNPGEDP
jgi:cobalt-zinc-cadmium efflux system outer membrane protein